MLFDNRGITPAGLLVLVVILLIAASLIGQYWLAPMIFEQNRQSGEEIAKNSLSSEKAMQDYRWFRAQWYEIQAQHDQTENYRDQEEQFHNTWGNSTQAQDWPRDVRTRHGRIHDRITGSENREDALIGEYNARQEDATRAIFQCGLPYNIDKKLFIADATGVEYTSQEAMDMEPPEDPSNCQFAQDPEQALGTSTDQNN